MKLLAYLLAVVLAFMVFMTPYVAMAGDDTTAAPDGTTAAADDASTAAADASTAA